MGDARYALDDSSSDSSSSNPATARDCSCCSLADFAAAVHAAVAKVGHGDRDRFGHRKVFVSAAHRALPDSARPITLDAFKCRLIDCNRESLLELARADLVDAMPGDVVAASEIRDLGAEFHFVIDRNAREPWEVSS